MRKRINWRRVRARWTALCVAGLVAMLFGACASTGGKMGMEPRADNMDPQGSWPYEPHKRADKPGKFYINGQNEGYVTVFDANSQKLLKVINVWEYEYAQVRKEKGREPTEQEKDFIQKNGRPHHSWITPGGRFTYVSNTGREWDRFWVVDARTDEIVGHFNTGGMGPLHGAFSPYRDLAVWGAVQDRKNGVATFIDIRSHRVLGTVKTSGTQTRDVVFAPDNKHVYITNSGWDPDKGNMGGVDLIDIDAMKVVKHFDIPGSRGMMITYDGRLIAVASIRKGTVTFIDPTKHEIIKTIEIGNKPSNIAFDSDGTKAYIGLAGDKQFAVIDLKTMTLKTKIAAGKNANRVYLPPGNKKIAIGTSDGDDFVTIIDMVNDKKIKDIPTPLGAHNVAYTADGKIAIVSCNKSREAMFIDVEKLEEIGIIDKAGHGNNGVRWAPYGTGLGPDKPYPAS
jgi:DNA-binding beta-propeller fold protein YncE